MAHPVSQSMEVTPPPRRQRTSSISANQIAAFSSCVNLYAIMFPAKGIAIMLWTGILTIASQGLGIPFAIKLSCLITSFYDCFPWVEHNSIAFINNALNYFLKNCHYEAPEIQSTRKGCGWSVQRFQNDSVKFFWGLLLVNSLHVWICTQ